MKKYKLILQWQLNHFFDIDELIEKENAVAEAIGSAGSIDGHDIGAGQANIFINTDEPEVAFASLRRSALKDDLEDLKVAYRKRLGETYIVLWPPGETDFEVK